MQLRTVRRAVKDGKLILGDSGQVAELIQDMTEKQRVRIGTAVHMALFYLRSEQTTDRIGKLYDVTGERIQQQIRAGVVWLEKAGALRPADPAPDLTKS